MEDKEYITIQDFSKLDIRIGKVVSANKVIDTDKLIKFELDFGDEKRIIIGGWGISYPDPSELMGTLLPAILNLKPRVIRGIESQGMLLSAVKDNGPVALHPDKEV